MFLLVVTLERRRAKLARAAEEEGRDGDVGEVDLGDEDVARLVDRNEYKRRQAAPGVRISRRAFGRDRRYPITNRFRDTGKPLPKPDESLVTRTGKVSAEAFEG